MNIYTPFVRGLKCLQTFRRRVYLARTYSRRRVCVAAAARDDNPFSARRARFNPRKR